MVIITTKKYKIEDIKARGINILGSQYYKKRGEGGCQKIYEKYGGEILKYETLWE